MAKFIGGLLIGIIIGILATTYISDNDLQGLTVKARAALARHMPINN